EGFLVAGQAREVEQGGYGLACGRGLRRQVHREAHRQADFERAVLEEALHAAEGVVFGKKCRSGVGHEEEVVWLRINAGTSSRTASAKVRGASCGRLWPAPGTRRCERGP